jgi:hypothetical protein
MQAFVRRASEGRKKEGKERKIPSSLPQPRNANQNACVCVRDCLSNKESESAKRLSLDRRSICFRHFAVPQYRASQATEFFVRCQAIVVDTYIRQSVIIPFAYASIVSAVKVNNKAKTKGRDIRLTLWCVRFVIGLSTLAD